MKYKVGDKVRVRKDLKVGKRYGNDIFIKDMGYMKGKIVAIEKVVFDKYKIIEDYNNWTDEMLEPVEEIIEYKGKKYDEIEQKNYMICSLGKDLNEYDKVLFLKEHKEEILDEVEKRYLRNVIKYVIEPTHNEINCICKYKNSDGTMEIVFKFNNWDIIYLPYFKDKRMYKGMEVDKEYTVEELGLE